MVSRVLINTDLLFMSYSQSIYSHKDSGADLDITTIEYLTSGVPQKICCGIVVIFFMIVGWILNSNLGGVYKRLLTVITTSITSTVCFALLGFNLLFGLFLFVSSFVIAITFVMHCDIDERLEVAVQNIDQRNFYADPLKALEAIRAINIDCLFGKQVERYWRYYIDIQVALGNNRMAKDFLEEKSNINKVTNAYRHFTLHLIAHQNANLVESYEHIHKAMAFKDSKDTDIMTVLQLEHNRAMVHVDNGQYLLADEELNSIRRTVNEKQIRNRDFLNVLYENISLNKTRLNLPDNGWEAGIKAINEYENFLNTDSICDSRDVFRMRLLFFRQLSVGAEVLNTLIEGRLFHIVNSRRISGPQKLIELISLLNDAWVDHIDPTKILDRIASLIQEANSLPPAGRYSYVSLLFEFFQYVDPDTVKLNPSLDYLNNYAKKYIASQACPDLDAALAATPEEAKSIRIDLHSKRAFLALISGNRELAKSNLMAAINLAEDNCLELDAMGLRLKLASSLVYSDPATTISLVERTMRSTEALATFPSLGYIYIRSAYCYALLNKNEECLAAYGKYKKSRTNLNHYGPGIGNELLTTLVCLRFFAFMNGIDRLIKCDEPAEQYTSSVVDWIHNYPCVDSLMACVLVGSYLGINQGYRIYQRASYDSNGDSITQKCWIYIPQIDASFDPLLQCDDHTRFGCVFPGNKHPALTMTLEGSAESIADAPQYAPGSLEVINKDQQMTVNPLLDAIQGQIEADAPTIEEILNAQKRSI